MVTKQKPAQTPWQVLVLNLSETPVLATLRLHGTCRRITRLSFPQFPSTANEEWLQNNHLRMKAVVYVQSPDIDIDIDI